MLRTYKIVQWTTGLACCSYLAWSSEEALNSFAIDAGYASFDMLVKDQPGFNEVAAIAVIEDTRHDD